MIFFSGGFVLIIRSLMRKLLINPVIKAENINARIVNAP
jgi:uncharacterized protein YneF (UPF0154 family)